MFYLKILIMGELLIFSYTMLRAFVWSSKNRTTIFKRNGAATFFLWLITGATVTGYSLQYGWPERVAPVWLTALLIFCFMTEALTLFVLRFVYQRRDKETSQYEKTNGINIIMFVLCVVVLTAILFTPPLPKETLLVK